MGAGHVLTCFVAIGVIIWWYTSGSKKQKAMSLAADAEPLPQQSIESDP